MMGIFKETLFRDSGADVHFPIAAALLKFALLLVVFLSRFISTGNCFGKG